MSLLCFPRLLTPPHRSETLFSPCVVCYKSRLLALCLALSLPLFGLCHSSLRTIRSSFPCTLLCASSHLPVIVVVRPSRSSFEADLVCIGQLVVTTTIDANVLPRSRPSSRTSQHSLHIKTFAVSQAYSLCGLGGGLSIPSGLPHCR